MKLILRGFVFPFPPLLAFKGSCRIIFRPSLESMPRVLNPPFKPRRTRILFEHVPISVMEKMKMGSSRKILIRPLSAAILGGGLVLAAGVAGHYGVKAVKASKTLSRGVTVRGLSEREVKADLAIWPISFQVAANSLPELQAEIGRCRASIEKFLLAQGFEKAEISMVPPKIRDFEANGEVGEVKKPFRYSAETSVALRSSKTESVVKAMEAADSLIRDGVPLGQGDYERHPSFLFTALSSVKPAMIEEANKDARKAAEKFAQDASCGVGRITRATQGSFEIDERDPQNPQMKIVRVVTTVEFLLE